MSTTVRKEKAGKSTNPSKIITLKLSSSALRDFPSTPSTPSSKAAESNPSPPSADEEKPDLDSSNTGQLAPESNATPDPTSAAPADQENSNEAAKRKGIPGPKPGFKRAAASQDADGVPKQRGKPGPKKRKLDIDVNGNSTTTLNQPKLGPKANQGAINAGLRALDRSGKPCRRWHKKSFQLKSFTGVTWDLPYWQTARVHKLSEPNGDGLSHGESSSDAKMEPPSSNIGSEKSSQVHNNENNGNGPMSLDVASSPAPIPATG